MKKISSLAAFALTLTLTVLAQAAAPYQPKNQSYKIQFPGAPTEQVDKSQSSAGELSSVNAIYETANGAYVSSYTDIGDACQKRKVDVQTVLKNSREGALAANKAKLIREKPLQTGGIAGTEFLASISEKGEKGVILHQIFFSDKTCRIYQAIVTGPEGIESKPETTAFFASFEGMK
ncbi:MAG TPA: hypothetical protein VJR29_05100 [bacterium]|nr:hypothetical protein [bacterium]